MRSAGATSTPRRPFSHGALFLRRSVHVARAGEDLVFLDRSSDAYSVLRGLAGDVSFFSGTRRCELSSLARGVLEPAGLLACEDGPGAPMVDRVPARLDDLEAQAGQLGLMTAASLACGMAASALLQAGRSVGALAGSSELPAAAFDTPPDDRTIQEAVRFREALSFYPTPATCLFSSFALRRRLRRLRRPVLWVFGVRTWPFQAHCWLQCGGVVLNDAAERLVGFSPILLA